MKPNPCYSDLVAPCRNISAALASWSPCIFYLLFLLRSYKLLTFICFQSTSTSSVLEVLHSVRYINLNKFTTNLLTYLLTYGSLWPFANSAASTDFAGRTKLHVHYIEKSPG